MIARRLVACFVIFVALSACSSGSPATPNDEPPPTSAPITEIARPTATIAPTSIPVTPTSTSPPSEPVLHPLRSDATLSFQSIEMFDENTGWAVGGVVDEDVHILQTNDGGISWRDVTPPGIPVGANFPKMAVGDFTHPETGWVRYLDSMNVWKTTDGGTTWRPVRLFEEFLAEIPAPYPIQFIDDQIGWALLYAGSGMSHDFSFLFHTSDGGLTWEALVTPYDEITSLQSCCKTGMVFYDAQVGVITYEQGPYQYPYLDWTVDGGTTWESWIFQPPDEDLDIPFSHYCETHSPHVFSWEDVLIGLTCQDNDDPELGLGYLVRTTDWGSTWEYFPSPLGQLFFIDSLNGWALGSDLYSTADGGATWTYLSHVDWQGQFDFIDLLNGWAFDDSGSLYRTVDGGLTWQLLEPRIANRE